MVTDINPVLEKRGDDGEWTEVVVENFLYHTNYRLFAWMADVRNYAGIVPLDGPRGLPPDFAYDTLYYERVGEHDFSWLSLDEMLSVDFEQLVEDRRTSGIGAGGLRYGNLTCAPGEGEVMTLRAFLGDVFLDDLRRAKAAGAERIVFGFNS